MTLQPLTVGGDGEVGVRDVFEGTIHLKARVRGGAVLVASGLVRDSTTLFDRGTEPFSLLAPLGTSGGDVEQRAQEVFRRGVLVESAGEIRDGRITFILADDGRIEQQRASIMSHRARLRGRHAFEHLDLKTIVGAEFVAKGKRPCDLKQVVTGDADAQRSGGGVEERVIQHCLIAGIHIRLGRIRRGLPIVQFGFDGLHREVGALDQPDLDARSRAFIPGVRPVDQRAQRCVRIGDVGL